MWIFLFLIVFAYVIFYVIDLLIKKRLTEGFSSTYRGEPNEPITVNDSHYFLMTSVLPGKKDIALLKEKNPNHSNYYYVDQKETIIEQTDPRVVEHRQSSLDHSNLTCIDQNAPIRKIIKEYQPYMYDEPELVNLYDYPFYRDWRYPERPIDLRFAIDPQKYSEKNPLVYPSYKYFSKW
jgi:hypothetical protein